MGAYGKVYVAKCLVSSMLHEGERGDSTRRIKLNADQEKKIKRNLPNSVNMQSNIEEVNKLRRLEAGQYYVIKEIESDTMTEK